jgi:hypothetical protein
MKEPPCLDRRGGFPAKHHLYQIVTFRIHAGFYVDIISFRLQKSSFSLFLPYFDNFLALFIRIIM